MELLKRQIKKMLLSHRKKFIFIHNYKVAGTSIRAGLNSYNNHTFRSSSHLDKLKLLAGIYPRVFSSQFVSHISAAQLKKEIPSSIFDSYFKFGFVRNPWDWQVSLYTFMLKTLDHHQHELIKGMKSFDEYIDWRVHNDLHLQKSFFYENDVSLMDYIGRMENLQTDFEKICGIIGAEVKLPHLNPSRNDNDYLKYYSKHSIEMVSQAFREDIELFNYAIPENP